MRRCLFRCVLAQTNGSKDEYRGAQWLETGLTCGREARAIGQFTVRAYVGALGGEVEIVAKFGDERFTIG